MSDSDRPVAANVFPVDALLTRPPQAARHLLGAVLVHRTAAGTTSGIIVETEAYCESDPASHTFGGKTQRNQIMFERAGHAYVYFTYGMHWCFNVVTGPEGSGEAALIRSLQPLTGLALMARRRGLALPEGVAARRLTRTPQDRATRKVLTALCSGPARLAQAMGFDRRVYGTHLLTTRGALRLRASERPVAAGQIVASPRIGIRKATETRWRFHLAGNLYVSSS